MIFVWILKWNDNLNEKVSKLCLNDINNDRILMNEISIECVELILIDWFLIWMK